MKAVATTLRTCLLRCLALPSCLSAHIAQPLPLTLPLPLWYCLPLPLPDTPQTHSAYLPLSLSLCRCLYLAAHITQPRPLSLCPSQPLSVSTGSLCPLSICLCRLASKVKEEKKFRIGISTLIQARVNTRSLFVDGCDPEWTVGNTLLLHKGVQCYRCE